MLLNNYSNHVMEAGTDEAGRGCLAGPVTAAAVVLSHDFIANQLNDSKKIHETIRYALRPLIETTCISFAVTHIEPDQIDVINILNASILAMQESIKKLSPIPSYIIVDGNRFKPVLNIPYTCIVKGDAKYMSIAAASVLAKTYRDDYMTLIHDEFPMYNWKQNKGYPTQEHRNAIAKYGITKYHRKSFKLLEEQFKLDFVV